MIVLVNDLQGASCDQLVGRCFAAVLAPVEVAGLDHQPADHPGDLSMIAATTANSAIKRPLSVDVAAAAAAYAITQPSRAIRGRAATVGGPCCERPWRRATRPRQGAARLRSAAWASATGTSGEAPLGRITRTVNSSGSALAAASVAARSSTPGCAGPRCGRNGSVSGSTSRWARSPSSITSKCSRLSRASVSSSWRLVSRGMVMVAMKLHQWTAPGCPGSRGT